jgi:hypothetical protein
MLRAILRTGSNRFEPIRTRSDRATVSRRRDAVKRLFELPGPFAFAPIDHSLVVDTIANQLDSRVRGLY